MQGCQKLRKYGVVTMLRSRLCSDQSHALCGTGSNGASRKAKRGRNEEPTRFSEAKPVANEDEDEGRGRGHLLERCKEYEGYKAMDSIERSKEPERLLLSFIYIQRD